MTSIGGKVAVVTGAGSGIGRALALALVRRGAAVAISDWNEQGLAETENELRALGRVSAHKLDVRDRAAMAAHAADVERLHGGADILINNAGVSHKGTIEEMAYEDFARVIDVNLWGVVNGIKAFMPLLRKRREGHIVNLSSINAMVPFAQNGPYSAAKYAVLGLSETLMMELQGSSIHVTCVHPGGVRTNIARHSGGISEEEAKTFDRLARTTPESAAQQICRAIERNQQRLLIGTDAKVMALAKRLLPGLTVSAFGFASTRMQAQKP